MGCGSSKQNKRCRHCHRPYTPITRSYSMHAHHPPQGDGDGYHVVALTSSTLGYLKLDLNKNNHNVGINGDDHLDVDDCGGGVDDGDCGGAVDDDDKSKSGKDCTMGLVEAKVWSSDMEEKIQKLVPKTPVSTPPGEPETINTWELMEGLEDFSPLMRSPNHIRSFSFDVVKNLNSNAVVPFDDLPLPKSKLTSEFDPEVVQTFEKPLEALSPRHPFHLRQRLEKLENENENECENGKQEPTVAGNQLLLLDSLEGKKAGHGVVSDQNFERQKVVVYFTSLRGVRKTYEDCCHVRVVLKSLGIRVDERDVSMHSGFKEELKGLLGNGVTGVSLPRVFLGKEYIGGAEEIRRLHEEGQLEKMLEECEKVDELGGVNGVTCEACGDIRFVPCETCSGSCKIYYEKEEEDEGNQEQWEGEENEFGFQRCPDCNENGLIRCPICCY